MFTMSQKIIEEHFPYIDNTLSISIFDNYIGIGKKDLYLHCHNCMELIYIECGKGFFYVDFQEFTVGAGDFILILPNQLHSGKSKPHNEMHCKAIVFDLNQLKEGKIDYIYKKYIYEFISHTIVPKTLVQRNDSLHHDLANNFFTIYDEFFAKKEAYECFIKGALFNILGILYRNSEKYILPYSSKKQDLTKIRLALQFISENYNKSISIDDLASITGYNKYYLMHFFKNVTDLTITQYINMIRLDKAAQLLLNSNLSITDISIQVGFNNISYFIKQFTKRYNKTPKKFRS